MIDRHRLAWIDWMKCLGMLLIVLGHTGGLTGLDQVSTFNYKQLGVAFFVFVMGYSLAQDTRRPLRVLYNRLFEIYLFGSLFAVVMSVVTWFTIGDLQESNYLPLALGVNVLFDFFPANPTTWYIGTYLHLLLLWAVVLRRVRLRPWMLGATVCFEVVVRAALMQAAGDFIAYMLLTNWLGAFLLGGLVGRQAKDDHEVRPRSSSVGWAGYLAVLIVGVLAWRMFGISFGELKPRFPFRLLPLDDELSALLATSCSISLVYLLFTWLVFETARRLPHVRIIEFFARNTLIVFIVHMPLIYALTPLFSPFVPQGPLRILLNTICFYAVPVCASELTRRLIRPKRLREVLLARFQAVAVRPS